MRTLCICVFIHTHTVYRTHRISCSLNNIYKNTKHTRKIAQDCCDRQVCSSHAHFDTNCQLSQGVRKKKGPLWSLIPDRFPENHKSTKKVTFPAHSTHQVSNKESVMKTQLGRAIPEERPKEQL